MSTALIPVDVEGHVVGTVDRDDRSLVQVNQLAHDLGLNPDALVRRVRRNSHMFSTTTVVVETASGRRPAAFLDVDDVPGLAMTIDTRRMAAEQREVVRFWQGVGAKILREACRERRRSMTGDVPALRGEIENLTAQLAGLKLQVIRGNPRWMKIYRLAALGLNNAEIAKVADCSDKWVAHELGRMRNLGISPPPPPPLPPELLELGPVAQGKTGGSR